MPILAADLVDFAMLSEFIALISTPSLKAVATHWDAVRGARLMPSWEDLQPKAIGSQLAIAWSLKYDRADGSFTGRLAGDRINRLVGKNFRGLPLAQSQSPASFASMHPLLSRVVREPAAFCGYGMVFRQADRFIKGERIVLHFVRRWQRGRWPDRARRNFRTPGHEFRASRWSRSPIRKKMVSPGLDTQSISIRPPIPIRNTPITVSRTDFPLAKPRRAGAVESRIATPGNTRAPKVRSRPK